MRQILSRLLIGCVFLLCFGACASGGVSQTPDNTTVIPGETATPPDVTSPVAPAPPAEPLPPPSIPLTPDQANQGSSQIPPYSNTPTGDSLDATTMITKQASQMTLTLNDMGSGWGQEPAIAPALQQVSSSSHVSYSQGSSFAPGVQNTVAVYRSISAAENAYAKEKQANLTASSPNIGNECLLNDAVPINKLLVFRKNNVVVWLWVKQYKEGDIEGYARIVEQKINAAASQPISPGQPSQTVTTPEQQNPVEPSGDIQPAITKSLQAYDLVLTKEDMGPGWVKGNISPPPSRGSTSASHVYYSQGGTFAAAVQNTVAVYRNAEAAAGAYASAKPSGATLLYPSIGNECFLNDSVSIDRLLVFRKSNVVVWVWLKQYKDGDIESYARIVEKKIP